MRIVRAASCDSHRPAPVKPKYGEEVTFSRRFSWSQRREQLAAVLRKTFADPSSLSRLSTGLRFTGENEATSSFLPRSSDSCVEKRLFADIALRVRFPTRLASPAQVAAVAISASAVCARSVSRSSPARHLDSAPHLFGCSFNEDGFRAFLHLKSRIPAPSPRWCSLISRTSAAAPGCWTPSPCRTSAKQQDQVRHCLSSARAPCLIIFPETAFSISACDSGFCAKLPLNAA